MKKVMNLVIGGLQQKIFNLVLFVLILIIAAYTTVLVVQTNNIQALIAETNEAQQASMRQVADETMDAVLASSLGTSTQLQAYIADSVFQELQGEVELLGGSTEALFAEPESFAPQPVALPDANNDGTPSLQLLAEEGVDVNDPEIVAHVGLLGNLSGVMESLFENFNVNSCFIGTPDGVVAIMDDRAGAKFSEDGELLTLAVRERPWYLGAVERGDVYFTDVEEDAFTGQIGIVCAQPVYVDGELVAVVGADLFLDSMAEAVRDSGDTSSGFICIVNEQGHVIFSAMDEGVFRAEVSGSAQDLRESADASLAQFVQDALVSQTDVRTVLVGEKGYYMAGAPLPTVGWTVLSIVDKEITRAPAEAMISQYNEINQEALTQLTASLTQGRTMIIILLLIVFALTVTGALVVAKRIVKPLNTITKRVASLGGNDLLFEMEDAYRTGDEIEVLAESFARLSAKTLKYVDEVTRITAEKERIGAELDVATRIQNSLLPSIFPAFPERPEFDIYASMTPAKEVGGDFYDFFMIDDDHLGMVIADVSGKGVPAALFMMMSKIIISNNAKLGLSPKETLERANAQIGQNNDAEMFVTVWFGILTLSTGKVVAANAGHEYPMITGADGKFELMKDRHGFVLGAMEGVKYREYEFELNHGGSLFLYTDGVAEATSAANELFGTERTLEALNNSGPDASPEQLLTNVKAAVDEFVGDAPQFDDLTMLAVKYK